MPTIVNAQVMGTAFSTHPQMSSVTGLAASSRGHCRRRRLRIATPNSCLASIDSTEVGDGDNEWHRADDVLEVQGDVDRLWL
ncbi:hypothetical protein EUGRSUZ_E03023 [Eucalyptus grandis]|uniref:Uncharacterized protein n=2 Tax=Eucalyptus grandis TaxID=71139 RepID=A0ACC3KZK8_EUCGR|nr:hypothetical protein EUGRSUZ_E03023 [Eucalyptus grandis]